MIAAGSLLSNRFELIRRIGTGGMGEVFEAHDRARDDVVALKTLSRADGDTLARFKREFRALQSIAHPNLVSLHELIGDGDQWFFTMELVRGQHFLDYVGRDVARLRAAIGQLVQGVRVLHEGGLVHRDLKPSNVMVTGEGRVVVLDFGLVTTLDPARQSTAPGAIGTVEYMAPEQAVGGPITEAADWYAVGVMLYEALTGKVPHVGHALQILVEKQQHEARAPDELAPDAPADLVALCNELLRIEPARRPDGAAIARRLGLGELPRWTTTTGTRRAVFVGRERELAALATSFRDAQDRPIVHLVVGESGIGKTELVARWCQMVQDDDASALVFRGRCYERESVPYKALDGVIDSIAQHLARQPAADLAEVLPARASLLERLFPVFIRVEAIASAPSRRGDDAGEPQEIRRRRFQALRELLGAIARRRRVLFAIDDLQWADADSFLLLRELLRGSGAPPVLVVATVRDLDEEDAVPAALIPERLGAVAVRRSDLGPLSEDECRALAERMMPDLAGDGDVARIAREARGHPMFLHEILRHLSEGGGGPTSTLDDALWGRVALLGPDAHTLLEVISLAGAPIALDVASAACRLEGTAVARASASLRVASLAREAYRGGRLALEPYHDRVREAVAGRIDRARGVELHGRLAVALEQGSGPRDPQLLFHHFQLAGRPERAARYAEDAARRSLAAHAFDQAVELWRSALELIPHEPDEQRHLQLQLGEALVAAGRAAEAAAVFELAAEGADRATRLECHRQIAEQLLISGHIGSGVAALEQLLADIGIRAAPTPRRALAWLVARRAALRLRGLRFKARDRTEVSDADILRLDVLRVAATGLSVVDTIRGQEFQVRQLLLALRVGHPPHIARALVLEATHHANHGDIAHANELFERSRRIEGFEADPYRVAQMAGGEGVASYSAGELARAQALLQEGETLMRDVVGATWEHSSIKLFTLFVLRFVGDFLEMRRRYDQYAAEAAQRGDQYLASTMRRACVPMWLAEDDPDGALRDLERATWVPETVGFHVQHFHELIARAEIAMYVGAAPDVAELERNAAGLRRSMLLRVHTVRAQYGYLLGRLAANHGDRRTVLRNAHMLARTGHPVAMVFERLLQVSAAALRDNREAIAVELERAIAASEQVGMKLCNAVARLRKAELEATPALADAATRDLIALGVRAPERMAALVLPMRPR